jgi:hypothetical protein
MTRDISPQCEIDKEKMKEFFSERWGTLISLQFREVDDNDPYKLKRTINLTDGEDEFKKVYMNRDFLIKQIGKRENLSAQDLDKLTYLILKLEKERAADMLLELMEFCWDKGWTPSNWKEARTIILFKGGKREDLSNWRPITLTSII